MKVLKTLSIIVIVLGCIHCIATPSIASQVKMLPDFYLNLFVYSFFMTGVAVALTGFIQFKTIQISPVNKHGKQIFGGTILFLFASGLWAVIIRATNPFAYIIILLAIGQTIVLTSRKKSFKHEAIN